MEKSDRDIIISIVANAFEENPRVMAMMKKKNPARSVRLMTEYAYDLVEKFDGIYLSKDKTTILFDFIIIFLTETSCSIISLASIAGDWSITSNMVRCF